MRDKKNANAEINLFIGFTGEVMAINYNIGYVDYQFIRQDEFVNDVFAEYFLYVNYHFGWDIATRIFYNTYLEDKWYAEVELSQTSQFFNAYVRYGKHQKSAYDYWGVGVGIPLQPYNFKGIIDLFYVEGEQNSNNKLSINYRF